MRRTVAVTLAALTVATLAPAAPPASAAHPRAVPTISINGAVAAPLTYTTADLAAQPQTTLTDLRRRHHTGQLTGVLLEPLIAAAGPDTPAGAKNPSLRVTVTVTGNRDTIAVALGEITPRFGNHPALLVADGHGRHTHADLVFPGDNGTSRTVDDVRSIKITVAGPSRPDPTAAGGITITNGRRHLTLSTTQLANLPATTTTVTYTSGGVPQTHTETGPTLADVLRAAKIRTSSTTTVTAVAGDDYLAVVTPAEATAGRRPLLLSLTEDGAALPQPRLVVDGDLAGGRYVSDVVHLTITDTCR